MTSPLVKIFCLCGFIFLSAPLLAVQKGIALGLYSKDPSYRYTTELSEIKATGADHVSLVVSWYQKNAHATVIHPQYLTKFSNPDFDYTTTPNAQLTDVIDQAHQLGLKVFLFPILRLERREDKDWRGSIKPKDPKLWWQSYHNFILSYARLSARHQVELLAVGSELCSMEVYNAAWRRLIQTVRDQYSGKLLYSANWDHYKKINFWRDLDFLGINGYYKLASHPDPTLAELTSRWYEIQKELGDWQGLYNRPIIFTEIGYPSVEGGSQTPWDYTRFAAVNLKEQALCYEAFFQVWGNDSRFGGVYFWNWFGSGGPEDPGYTPRNKPAGEVLTQWFQKLSPSSSPPVLFSPATPN